MVPITGTHLLGLKALWLTTGHTASACALMTIATNYATNSSISGSGITARMR
jgi:hypothetical protein